MSTQPVPQPEPNVGQLFGVTKQPAEQQQNYSDAIALINHLFAPTELVCIVATATEGVTDWSGVVHPASVVATPEFMLGLARLNDEGKSIFFCINPLKSSTPPAGHKSARCTENIAAIRNFGADVDENAEMVLRELQSLTPHGFVQTTSDGKLQKIWTTRGLTKDEFDQIAESVIRAGADEKVKDTPRLLRLPGFVNRKAKYADNPPIVTVTIQSNHVATFEEFQPLLAKHPPVDAVKSHERTANTATTEIGFLKMSVGVEPAEERIGEKIILNVNQPCPKCGGTDKNPNPFGFFEKDGSIGFKCHTTRREDDCPGEGDIITFVQRWDGVDIGTAIRKLKEWKFGSEQEFQTAFQQHLGLGAASATSSVKSATPKAEALKAFKYPAVEGTPYDFVVGPAVGAPEGWFARGDNHIVGGPSGSNKSTFMIALLESQRKRESFLGHPTYGFEYLILMADRGEFAHIRTANRMRFDPTAIPIAFIPSVTDAVAVVAVQHEIERSFEKRGVLPAVVFIEGGDMLTSNAGKMEVVTPFLDGLQRIAKHYHVAIVCSVGSPKQRMGEGYVSKRDGIFGTIAWSRKSETICVLQYIKGDDIDVRRTLSVLLRNGPAEGYDMMLENGRLVESPIEHGKEPTKPQIDWFKQRLDWFTAEDLKDGIGISRSTADRYIKDAISKGILKMKTGPKGGARLYKWKEPKASKGLEI